MAFKFEILGTANILVITDTSGPTIFLETPRGDAYFDSKYLIEKQAIWIYDTNAVNEEASRLVKPIPLAEAQDETGTPFGTEDNFRLWARENLGFKTASGGSGAVNSVNSGEGINVDNSDPANPIINKLPNERILLKLTTVQDINSILGTFADFSTVQFNNIIGSSVSLDGTVTLPIGKYRTSFKINHSWTSATRKNCVAIIISQFPTNLFVLQSATFSYIRSDNNPQAALICPMFAPPEMTLLAPREFRILTTQAGDGGISASNTALSFWEIEKIG